MDVRFMPITNMNFCGKKPVILPEEMNNVIKTLVSKKTPIKEMAEITGLTEYRINISVREIFGVTLNKLYKKIQESDLAKIFAKWKDDGCSISDIIKKSERSKEKTRSILKEHKIIYSTEDIQRILDENMPRLIKEGKTEAAISAELNLAKNQIRKWIHKHYVGGIVRARHLNNTTIKREENEKQASIRKRLSGMLNEGKTISEIAETLNSSCSYIFYWMKKFNLSSKKQEYKKRMAEDIPRMMSKKMSIDDMAKNMGMARSVISRWIRYTYGKNYSEIKKDL